MFFHPSVISILFPSGSKIKLNELSEYVGITISNLSILKQGKAKAIKLSTLNSICKVLDCQPGDILEYRDSDVS